MTDDSDSPRPLFMVYSNATDQPEPLTQARLDELLATERQYGVMIVGIRESHVAHVKRLGYVPKSWPAEPK